MGSGGLVVRVSGRAKRAHPHPNGAALMPARQATTLGTIWCLDQNAWGSAAGVFQYSGPRGVGPVLDTAEQWGASQLWIHESGLAGEGLPGRLPRVPAPGPVPYFDARGTWQSSALSLRPHSYWYRKGANGIDLNVPGWADGSPFAGLPYAADLYREAVRLRDASGGRLVWKGSATITSDALIRRTCRGLVASEIPHPVQQGRGGELAYAWVGRTGPTVTQSGAHCYSYDLNLAYLNGASSLALGCGQMVPANVPVGMRMEAPGWWLVNPPSWPSDCPPPWLEQGFRRASGGLWVTTPTAKLTVELGGFVRAGWTFAEPSHRYLDRWYKTLRDARLGTMREKGPAYEAVKAVAQHGLGRLGSPRRKGGTDSPLYQPYWRNAVIAEMRTRLARRILQLKRYPVAIDVDNCYFITNAPDPESFAEWAGIPLGDGLGQFKVSGAMSGDEARRIIATKRDVLKQLLEGMTA